MRSIGKWKIKKLTALVEKEYSINRRVSADEIKDRVPDDWFDIWESAWNEIERLIEDKLNQLRYKGC